MKTITLKFPEGEFKTVEQGKPIVLLGANGAGKTRLSVKIEELNDQNFRNQYNSESFLVHRITAQKSLSLNESIIIKGLESSEREAITGGDHPNSSKVGYRYASNPATNLLNDYSQILSLFFARNNKQNELFYRKSTIASQNNGALPKPDKSLVDQAEEIWAYLLPERTVDLSGNEVNVIYNGERYHGKEMSDGERVILYMIIQALSVRKNSLLIIDEPELHIHKAILNKLWDKLEEIRQDCVFMYITHDLDFAVSRNVNEVLWVKSFDGKEAWNYEFLPLNDFLNLPEGLLFEVLGTQKKIIFVEGKKESLDYLLFQELYKELDYHVIPCGSCSQVINYVRAQRGYSIFNHIDVYGIIDRDYRTQHEIEALEKDGIYVLKVAEVENLFLIPDLLKFVRDRLGQEHSVVEEVKTFIVELFHKLKNKQMLSAFPSEVNHQLKTLNLSENVNFNEVRNEITNNFSKENIKLIFNDKKGHFNSINEYEEVLTVFNFKELSDKISPMFGLQKGMYRKLVIDLLKKPSNYQERGIIIEAIRPYIPVLPHSKQQDRESNEL